MGTNRGGQGQLLEGNQEKPYPWITRMDADDVLRVFHPHRSAFIRG
jgi:hypothetical protein